MKLASPGESLIGQMLAAPLIGIRARWPQTLHAITMGGLSIDRDTHTSACGLTGLRLLGVRYREDGSLGSAPWPPRVATLQPDQTRCAQCFNATGRMRPRSDFARASK